MLRLPGSCRARGLAVLCVGLLPAAAARPGSISISTEVTATAREGTLAVTLATTNSGDEAAATVVPQAEFGGTVVRGQPRPALGPGERMEVALEVPRKEMAPGQWPLVTRVDYADAKGYPFQALQVAVVAVMASPSLLAVVSVDVEPVAGSGALRGRLKSLSDAPRQVQVRLVVPRELEADPPSASLSLEPWADARVDARIRNRAALAGSRYPVFLVAEYDDQGVHHASVGQAVAAIEARTSGSRYLAVAAVGLMVAWVLLLALRRGRGGRGALSGSGPPGAPPATG
jgi:hypothetical protein